MRFEIVGYGTVQYTVLREWADLGMPDLNLPEKLPQPPDPATPTAAQVAEGRRESGPYAAAPAPAVPQGQPAAPQHGASQERLPYWLRQSEKFVRVVVRMYIGLGVCCVPWLPSVWDANPLFLSSPHLQAFMTQGAVRGLVSGLGLLNLWIALRDALSHPADAGPERT